MTVAAAAAVAVLLVVALVWWLGREEVPRPSPEVRPAPSPSVTPTPAPAERSGPCGRPARSGFVPTRISVDGVVRGAEVRALPRDADGVVGVPPVADRDVFAWDRDGVEPGSRTGHVLLNTHTWPDGSAMGNRLLRGLEVGDGLRLSGAGRSACYRVSRRVEVREEDGYPGWSAQDGPPQVVIVVCSGDRLGPGRWTHRTLWFATPVR